ncbi:MAG TPA: hypothetical protein VIR78_10865 [Malonomonas sp.]
MALPFIDFCIWSPFRGTWKVPPTCEFKRLVAKLSIDCKFNLLKRKDRENQRISILRQLGLFAAQDPLNSDHLPRKTGFVEITGSIDSCALCYHHLMRIQAVSERQKLFFPLQMPGASNLNLQPQVVILI